MDLDELKATLKNIESKHDLLVKQFVATKKDMEFALKYGYDLMRGSFEDSLNKAKMQLENPSPDPEKLEKEFDKLEMKSQRFQTALDKCSNLTEVITEFLSQLKFLFDQYNFLWAELPKSDSKELAEKRILYLQQTLAELEEALQAYTALLADTGKLIREV